MKKMLAAGVAAIGIVLVAASAADAAQRFGGFRGGAFRSGFHGGGFRGGIFIGPGLGWYDPFWWPSVYPYGFPWLPPEVVVRYAPPAGYLARPNGPAPQQFWYRCGNPEGYFPYVRQCMTGWEQVPVTPPGSASTPGN